MNRFHDRSGEYVKICIVFIVLSIYLLACTSNQKVETSMVRVKTMDLSQYSADPPNKPINLLFIHHSTGGQLLADKGPDVGTNCIYKSHPNGGGLRYLLEQNKYIVHEASYGSIIGDKTDICDWNSKFRDQMDKILTCKHQDSFFTDGTRNKVIMFKSCFPNSYIESDGTLPGDPDSCIQTTANYKSTYNALLDYFSKNPDILFVIVTAPPLVQPKPNMIKEEIKKLLGRTDTINKVGPRVRAFNNWLKDVDNGWLKDYQLKNVVVFDYYDVLTDHGKSNWSLYPATDGRNDSHPSSQGNTIAAKEFIPHINTAVHRMGL